MANIRTQGRGVNVIWGTSSANLTPAASPIALCVSARTVLTSERIPVIDDNGVPVGTIYVPQYTEADYEILVETNTAVPNIGDNITIGGQNVCVENVEYAWEQKGIAKLRVRGAALP